MADATKVCQRMYHGDERHVRAAGHRFPQRRRALGGQLGHQLVGQRGGGLTAFRRSFRLGLSTLSPRCFVRLADEAALNLHAAVIAKRHDAPPGMLQNLVVEPECGEDGRETGCYFVTIGEIRRLAQLLRARRGQIRKTDLICCVLGLPGS